MRNTLLTVFIAGVIFLTFGCVEPPPENTYRDSRAVAEKLGTVYTPFEEKYFRSPVLTKWDIEYPNDMDAVWGATGRDSNGNVYVGLSSHGGEKGTSVLYRFDPEKKTFEQTGDTVEQLKLTGDYSSSIRQNKLHSKIYQASDGYLYFSSFDEGGESLGINPRWGGFLWRKKPESKLWELLLSTDEALIAVNTNGRFVYALGYWGHVLYQLDTATMAFKRKEIGSVGMHISRNLLVNLDGHTFVPKLVENRYGEIEAYLVELDSNLNIVAENPMPSYLSEDMDANHGIISYATNLSGTQFFVTHEGHLFKIEKDTQGVNRLSKLGKIYDNQSGYFGSLFSLDGEETLVAFGKPKSSKDFYSVVYHTGLNSQTSSKLNSDDITNRRLSYGSVTRLNSGEFVIVGQSRIRPFKPLFITVKF